MDIVNSSLCVYQEKFISAQAHTRGLESDRNLYQVSQDAEIIFGRNIDYLFLAPRASMSL